MSGMHHYVKTYLSTYAFICLIKYGNLFCIFMSVVCQMCSYWKMNLVSGCDGHSTAEKNNIPWREMTKEILESDVYRELESIQNHSIVYPDCNSLCDHFRITFLLTFLGIFCKN